MEITEIRLFQKEGQDKKLRAYTTVTFDNVFVVRNIKIIQGANGLFIAMPSRKVKHLCRGCHAKYEVGSKFCSQCGVPVGLDLVAAPSPEGKSEHRDIAHPITQEFRDYLQGTILKAYEMEMGAGNGARSSSEDFSSEVNYSPSGNG